MSKVRSDRHYILLILLAAFIFAVSGASAEGNLLADPGITAYEGGTEAWGCDAWDASRTFFGTDVSYDDSDCLYIYNFEENDARYTQTVSVFPDTYYRISGRVKAQGCEGGAGANLSLLYTNVLSEGVFDTDGEWVTLELYGVTGADQYDLTFCARLGGYSATTTGEAWFDDLEICEIDAASIPEDFTAVSFDYAYSGSGSDDNYTQNETDESSGSNIIIYTALWMLTALAIYIKAAHGSPTSKRGSLPAVLLLSLSLVIRVVIAAVARGYETDIACFTAWAQRIYELGPAGFYASGVFCDYPPLYMLILWPAGLIMHYIPGDTVALLAIKAPNIIADIALGYAIWRAARPRFGSGCAALICCLFLLNPAVIYDSAVWGQTDCLCATAVISALFLFRKHRYDIALPVFAVSVLLKPQALLFAPFGFAALIIDALRSGKKCRISAAIGAVIALAVFYLTGFIFSLNTDTAGNLITKPVIWLYELYTGTLGSYSYYSVNACNLWHLLGLDWVPLEGIAAQIPGWAAYAAAAAFAVIMYLKGGKNGHIYTICAAMISIMFCFGLKMHERYIFPVIPLAVFAYAEERDIRSFLACLLASAGCTVNMAVILIYGYTLYAPEALNIFACVLNLGACALCVWTAADISLRGNIITITRIYKPKQTKLKSSAAARILSGEDHRMHLKKVEILLMAVVTIAYSVFTFTNLGTLKSPQTSWTAVNDGESVTFDLGDEKSFIFTYYGGICDCTFNVAVSSDGEEYTDLGEAVYDQGEIFRWLWFSGGETLTARYVRITAQSGLVLSEVGFLDSDGIPLEITRVLGDQSEAALSLIDEQDTVPDHPSYYNSSYFDEIYHVRTAYEHIHGMHTYEWTHPPLGKLLISCGILLFGMTPFGWRFSGALAGVVMVPVMYLLIRQLTSSKKLSLFGMLLLSLDCMHFTQTRVGTIDSFAVMFIMLMYLFMFRYVKMTFYRQKLGKTLVPLALCGISFALGCATKWICIYAGIGLAVLFFYTIWRRYDEYASLRRDVKSVPPEKRDEALRASAGFARDTVITLLWCCVFFIAVPLVVYYFSYYPQLAPDGNFSVRGVWETQVSMFAYHNSLADDTHYFRSPWYEWPLIIKPMWYYSGNEYIEYPLISSISCMGNPAVWWTGLAAILFILYRAVRSKGKDRPSLMVSIGFLSQFAPWVLISRSTFIYHYFASVPFIIIASALSLGTIAKRHKKAANIAGIVIVMAALLLCVMFYPIMSGLPVSNTYASYLRWFNWYNYAPR